MKEIIEKKTFTVKCMIFIWVVFIILTCYVTSSLAVDSIYYRYTNPKPANTAGDCYLEIYVTGAKITGRLVDTRVGEQKPMNTSITFNGTLTGKWEAGKWLGEGDQNNGRIIGTWTGRNPQHNKDMDRLETYATSGRIEIFMSSSVGSGTLRVLMGEDVYEYNFRMQGRVITRMPAVKDPAPLPNPPPQISDGTLQLPPSVSSNPKIDSKALFSNISGQVEISRDGGKTWQFVKLNTVIYVGDHIKTGEDSKCVMGFADLSTFVLNPESEVVISTPPEKDSKLALVFGNIWVNVKKMVKDGSMEIEMSQAVMGIKGTIFEASHDRKTGIERVSVTEGKVEVRHKRTGKKVLVGSGQTVQIRNEGMFAEGAGTPGVSQTGGSRPGEFSEPAGAKYVGCYKDTGDRDLAGYSIVQNNMTTKLCVSICSQRGFAYSATQFGSYCFCGNTYGKHGTAQNCNMKCAGNSSLICGGDGANSVYDLSSQQPAKPVRESQIGQQAKAKADQLWNEGSALYRQNRISDALIKLKESLKYQSTPEKINTIQNIEAQQAKSKLDQPVAQTQSTCVIMYGANGKYNQKSFATGSKISCDNSTFGDPAYGIVKKCYIGSEVKASENESFIIPNTCYAGNLTVAQTGRAYTSRISTGGSSISGSTLKGLEEMLINELGANINTNLVFYNGNKNGVINNGRSPTFTSQQSRYIHFIMNYHYNSGSGATPGTISLHDSNGRTYGPWQAGGAYGNKHWIVQPGITLPAGSYTIIDSDPTTWSCNGGSGMYGHSLIKGRQWPLVR